MLGRLNLLLLSLGIFVFNYTSHAEVIVYKNHIVYPEKPEYLIVPKYSKKDSPHWSPGRGKSYIDTSRLSVRTTCNPDGTNTISPPSGDKDVCVDSKFEMLMFKAPTDRPWTDYWELDEFCCTPELFSGGSCPKLNSLIIPASLSGSLVDSEIVKASGVVEFNEERLDRHPITESGLYVLFMAVCDPNASPVSLDGSIDSLDPYGYVPADLFGDLPFYLILSISYSVVGFVWLCLCTCYSDQLMHLQYWITGVIFVGMVETALLFAHFQNWNDHGTASLAITITGLIFGTIKRAMSRVLVQLVALGYGVVRPSLGEDMNRVLYLGSAYFVLSFSYTMMVNIPSTTRLGSTSAYDVLSIVVFLLAMIDTTFYIWIFTSVNNLLVSLASRKQGVKYILYRNFRAVLFTMLLSTFLWLIYSTLLFVRDESGANANWREKWTVDAIWELIYFAVLVAIAVMWAPSKNSQRYAYSIELTQLEDDDEYNDTLNTASGSGKHYNSASLEQGDSVLDDEYGGRLNDEKDPFQGTGALDATMAIAKKA